MQHKDPVLAVKSRQVWQARGRAQGQRRLTSVQKEGSSEPPEESRYVDVMGKNCTAGCEGLGIQVLSGWAWPGIGHQQQRERKQDNERLQEESPGIGRQCL